MPRARWSTVGLALAAVAFVSACQPARPERGPSCNEVAQHLVDLAMKDNGAIGLPPQMVGVRDQFVEQCHEEGWSAAKRQCLSQAANQEATLECPAK